MTQTEEVSDYEELARSYAQQVETINLEYDKAMSYAITKRAKKVLQQERKRELKKLQKDFNESIGQLRARESTDTE